MFSDVDSEDEEERRASYLTAAADEPHPGRSASPEPEARMIKPMLRRQDAVHPPTPMDESEDNDLVDVPELPLIPITPLSGLSSCSSASESDWANNTPDEEKAVDVPPPIKQKPAKARSLSGASRRSASVTPRSTRSARLSIHTDPDPSCTRKSALLDIPPEHCHFHSSVSRSKEITFSAGPQKSARTKCLREAGLANGWYKVIGRGCAVRAGRVRKTKLLRRLTRHTRLRVVEIHGDRMRIDSPVGGWVSFQTKAGAKLLKFDSHHAQGPAQTPKMKPEKGVDAFLCSANKKALKLCIHKMLAKHPSLEECLECKN